MGDSALRVMICTCEKTMSLDAQAIGRACTGRITQADHLCGQISTGSRRRLPMAYLFPLPAPRKHRCSGRWRKISSPRQRSPSSTFEKPQDGRRMQPHRPKAAALIAAAAEDTPPIALVTLESNGVALIYGCDEVAIEVGRRLADRLDVTVLLTKPGDVTPRHSNEFPIRRAAYATGEAISANSNSRSTIMHFPRLRHAAGCCSESRAMARSRPATSAGSQRWLAAVSRA